MVVTDGKRPVSAKRWTASCTINLRFWRELEMERLVLWTHCQFPPKGASGRCLTEWRVFPCPLSLTAAGKGKGSLRLHRASPDPGCCSPDKTSKQPSSLLPGRTLFKEFVIRSYVAADCTTAGFDG